MNKQQASIRINKLKQLINEYRYHYHVLDESIMSDEAADSLKHELSLLEEQYPDLITEDSPSQRVAGEPLKGFRRANHSSRMLSLNDVFNEDELRAWEKRILKIENDTLKDGYFVDIKMDGLACAVIYEDGMLIQAITRGDGFVGEDVTANIKTIESIPLTLRKTNSNELFHKGRTEVRGEIVLYKKDFEQINNQREIEGLALFANPRNTAAGTIRQLDPNLVASRPLKFHAYDLIRENDKEVQTNAKAYEYLRSLGLLANNSAKEVGNLDQAIRYIKQWEEDRQDLPFNTDGLVIKVNNRNMYRRLGIVGKAPRAAIAYKYPAEQSTTKVKDIFISIGRTGSATPVAILEPVVIAGSTVQMATLHNDSEVQRKDIRIGDTVIVHKAGDIIPEIIEPLIKLRTGNEKKFIMPSNCPECSYELTKIKKEDVIWRCPNNSCPARSWKHIEHYASKSALDIEGLGEKNVIALIDTGLIKDQADIYSLTVDNILKLDRFALVSANKLVNAIQKKKNPSLAKFIYGLGIRHVGTQTAIDLANNFHKLENIKKATIEELSVVDGVGEVVAESIVAWFADLNNQKLLEKFKKNDVKPQEAATVNGALKGKRFVITGSLESMGREQAADKIRALAGIFQSSLGKDTDYLVIGSNVGSSKLDKAKKYGTNQLTETQFLKLINE